MLSPENFIALWREDGSALLRFPENTVSALRISGDDKAFLTQAGLPKYGAPFLTFDACKSGELPTVAAKWRLPREFERYRVIGFDGSGSPIALDEEANGEVVCLDHGNRFMRVLMNQCVRQLGESLLAYRKMIKDSQAEFGEHAFLDGKTSPETREALRQELARIDQAATKPDSFRHRELQNLDANAS